VNFVLPKRKAQKPPELINENEKVISARFASEATNGF
jgi:hypothetical protein